LDPVRHEARAHDANAAARVRYKSIPFTYEKVGSELRPDAKTMRAAAASDGAPISQRNESRTVHGHLRRPDV